MLTANAVSTSNLATRQALHIESALNPGSLIYQLLERGRPANTNDAGMTPTCSHVIYSFAMLFHSPS